jgi:hypothetical protein
VWPHGIYPQNDIFFQEHHQQPDWRLRPKHCHQIREREVPVNLARIGKNTSEIGFWDAFVCGLLEILKHYYVL